MKTRGIFVVSVVVVALILLLTKVVTFQYIVDNSLIIGTSLIAIYSFISSEQAKTRSKEAKAETKHLRSKIDKD